MRDYNKTLTATVYVTNNGRVLLHMHKKYNTWFPLGGHIEEDELPHEAVLREVKEESGLDVTLFTAEDIAFSTGLVGRIPQPLRIYNEGIGSEEEFLDFIYAATALKDTPCSEDDESDIFRWFCADELLCPTENIKLHIRNTALLSLYTVNGIPKEERRYFTETDGCYL